MEQRKIIKPIYELPEPIAPDEIWKPISPIVEVDPNYCISNYGRVFSGFCGRVLHPHFGGTSKYHQMDLRKLSNSTKYTRGTYLLHRLVMYTFDYEPGCEELQVNHEDGVKTNNYLGNLEWCTAEENMRHAYNTGLKVMPSGEDHPTAVLTNDQVRQVAELITTRQYTHKQISEMTGVSEANVNSIAIGKAHVDIYNEYNLEQYKAEPKYYYSTEELEKICQYFQDNKDKYPNNVSLFKATIKDVFGREYSTHRDHTTLHNIFHHNVHREITDKYNF